MAGCSCLKRMAIYRLVQEEAETAIYKCDDTCNTGVCTSML